MSCQQETTKLAEKFGLVRMGVEHRSPSHDGRNLLAPISDLPPYQPTRLIDAGAPGGLLRISGKL